MKQKRFVIAIDSFKGCLSSRQANHAVREGVKAGCPDAETDEIAVSDGGEGFLDAFAETGEWQRVTLAVHDPLMRIHRASYLRNGEKAVVEIAQAIGLALLNECERDPLHATSYGAGELLADALRNGCRSLTVGLGGTATSDCGKGLLQALCDGFGSLHQVPAASVVLATDVVNPLCGPNGAACVFAPQKGATPEMVKELERRAKLFAQESAHLLGYDRQEAPGAGAAGGVGYALMQYMNATPSSGAELLLDAVGFDERIRDASLVITGEGHADRQTLMGKLPYAVLQRAQRQGVPVSLLAGRVDDRDALLEAGFGSVVCINPPSLPQCEAMRQDVALHYLQLAAEKESART